jgi:hypothetical protein
VPALVLGASLLLAVTVWASGPASAQQTAMSKQVQMSQMAAQATAAAKSWHAPKSSLSSSRAAAVTTCPRGPAQSSLFTGDTGGFHEHIVNGARVAPNGGTPFEYVIFAGALLLACLLTAPLLPVSARPVVAALVAGPLDTGYYGFGLAGGIAAVLLSLAAVLIMMHAMRYTMRRATTPELAGDY